MFEFSCFLHPKSTSPDRDARCSDCGEIFDFPLRDHPERIGAYVIDAGISRGFYGAVFRGRHERTGRTRAFKLIPTATYAPVAEGGYGKDFEAEARMHAELSSDRLVAALDDWGTEDLRFGAHVIRCHWMEMEFVEGRTLSEVVAGGPTSPREVAQIAWDLLDIIAMLQQRQRFHNDLHGDNIFVVDLPESEARRQAIHPRVTLKVLDLGSADERSKSTDDRLGDLHWVARHILELLAAFERRNPSMAPATLRLTAQLRRVAEYYSGDGRDREPTPEDMKASIYNAWSFGERPWLQPVRLGSLSEHYNAQSLPAWFAPALLYDPDGRWAARLTGAGPQLLTGMRGCGKTILLRSLEWAARTYRWSGEDEAAVRARAAKDSFLGLFVSCAALLSGPRSEGLDLPLHRLFLAFCREVVRDVQVCELQTVGEVDYNALDSLTNLVAGVAPWFEVPSDRHDVVALENALSRALLHVRAGANGVPELTPRAVFDALAATTRQLVDLWANKTLLFLVDDVSTRYLTIANVEDLLSQLALQSPEFGFKISTETQTLELSTPSGEVARRDRDYATLPLGEEVFAQFLRGADSGVRFLEEILERRAKVTEGAPTERVVNILGRQKLTDIANTIRDQPSKTPVYWGIEALAGMCVGDIGDVLQLYDSIVDRGRDKGFPIPPDIQHRAATDLAESKLLGLAGRDEWLYSHAVAFAEASHRELRNSSATRLRQYSSIFVKMTAEEAPTLFQRVIDLIDAGVFVLTGGTPRTKLRDDAPFVQFKLAYRMILGLTNRMPLSKRDRFEPAGEQLADWLFNPTAQKLQIGKGTAEPSHDQPLLDLVAPSTDAISKSPAAHQLPFDQPAEVAPIDMPDARTLFDVVTDVAGEMEQVELDWSSVHVIGAYGFEDRALGVWERLAPRRPRAATMVTYKDPGHVDAIRGVISDAGVPTSDLSASQLSDPSIALRVVRAASTDHLLIDTTALSKSLIYLLVRNALRERGEVWVLHTCAAAYHPPNDELDRVNELFAGGDFINALELLDRVVSGEQAPFQTVIVGDRMWDPGQPSLLAAFVSLKHKRLTHLLDEMKVEGVAAIAQVHTAGRDTSRSVVGRRLAEALVQIYGGSVLEVGSLDHTGAYNVLRELHRDHALNGGYNLEIALSGSKMHAVAAAMFSSVAIPAAVFYSAPAGFEHDRFTSGTGRSSMLHLRRVETPNG